MSAGAVPSNEYLITSTVLTQNEPSITFDVSAFNGVYRHLKLILVQRGTNSEAGMQAVLRFNGDSSTSSYAMHSVWGNGSTVSTETVTTGLLGGIAPVCRYPGGTSVANTFGAGELEILDAYSSVKNKVIRNLHGQSSSENRIGISSGLWINTTPISSIYLQPQDGSSFAIGSRFSLYGVTA
jgi:hypothetical protein